jgi:type IV secretory pathway VirB2 component (pilin)
MILGYSFRYININYLIHMRKSFLTKFAIFAFSFLVIAGSTDHAQAQTGSFSSAQADAINNNAFTRTLCNAIRIVTGTGGKAFAAFAIISLGIGFFTGKVSWGLMIGVTAGIAAMFGAPTVVSAIAGGDAIDCKVSGGQVS